MGQNTAKTVAEVAVAAASLILAFMTNRKIAPEKFIKPDSTHLAGEDTPRLSGREEFEALAGTEPVTTEPDEVVATGVYGLKPWVDPYRITHTSTPNGRMVSTGRRTPDATDNAVMAVERAATTITATVLRWTMESLVYASRIPDYSYKEGESL